jgi:hypothetical protein
MRTCCYFPHRWIATHVSWMHISFPRSFNALGNRSTEHINIVIFSKKMCSIGHPNALHLHLLLRSQTPGIDALWPLCSKPSSTIWLDMGGDDDQDDTWQRAIDRDGFLTR